MSRKTVREQTVGDDALGRVTFGECARMLGDRVSHRRSTFRIDNGFARCDLGGTFRPSCAEMRDFASVNFGESGERYRYNMGDAVIVNNGEKFQYANAAARLYYEFIRQNTGIACLGLLVRAAGIIEISIVAQTKSLEKTIRQDIRNFGASETEIILPPVDMASLPANGSLFVRVRGIGEKSIVHGFRWLGYVREDRANLGERVFLIRTYGCRHTVMENIRTIAARLSVTHPEILRRSLFVVYDASDVPPEGREPLPETEARILELAGPNCGGGGNASLLMSLMLRLEREKIDAVSELIIMDDDAKTDAETIVRHDAYVTARKDDIVSTAIIYQSDHPSVIQEAGGIWGKFFSPLNHAVSLHQDESEKVWFPYLVRSTRDTHKEADCKYMGTPQAVEFATFIFISFPARLAARTGAPLPFFLRNDDVEICLRAIKNGGKVAVNPNLHAWHAQNHNPVSEFFSTLHSLVVNNAYGGLGKEYFYTTMLERISRIARAGNRALLRAYEHILEKFSRGPGWLEPASIYGEYMAAMKDIKSVLERSLRNVPPEVVEGQREKIHVVSLTDNCPATPSKEQVLFVDLSTSQYFSMKGKDEGAMAASLENCIRHLSAIVGDYDSLCGRWKDWVTGFDHVAFWNEIFADRPLMAWERKPSRPSSGAAMDEALTVFHKISTQKELRENKLPPGFTVEGYLAKNPDVAESKISPIQHWLKFGCKEGRQY